MRIVIAGVGRAGLAVAAELRGLGHEVTVVERDATVARRAFEQHGLVTHTGDATDPAILFEANVGHADIVVSMLYRDADNLAVAHLARHAGAKRIMARLRDPAYRPLYQAAGVQRILSEVDVLLGGFVTAIEFEAVTHSMFLGGGRSVAFELALPQDAAVDGKSVTEIASDERFPPSCVLAGLVEDDGDVIAPRGGSVLKGGTTVVLVTRRNDIASVIAYFLRRRAV